MQMGEFATVDLPCGGVVGAEPRLGLDNARQGIQRLTQLSGESHMPKDACLTRARSSEWLIRRKRTDRNVLTVRISERELHRSGVRIHVGLFFEARDKSARPWKCLVEIVHAKK
jgi:hypothetical protein